jgi:uncharacterized damage-inducible protein DinB
MTTPFLTRSVQDVLEQGLLFLDRLSDEIYARPLAGVFTGSLGAHYRHVLDHFLCLIEGIRTGEVNYDQRRRDPQLENSIVQARFVTEALMHEFRDLSTDALQRECVVSYRVGYGESREEAVPSNLAREVMFCVGHTIHHYAILKLLCADAGVDLPYEFGIAPSTLKHLETAGKA